MKQAVDTQTSTRPSRSFASTTPRCDTLSSEPSRVSMPR